MIHTVAGLKFTFLCAFFHYEWAKVLFSFHPRKSATWGLHVEISFHRRFHDKFPVKYTRTENMNISSIKCELWDKRYFFCLPCCRMSSYILLLITRSLFMMNVNVYWCVGDISSYVMKLQWICMTCTFWIVLKIITPEVQTQDVFTTITILLYIK